MSRRRPTRRAAGKRRSLLVRVVRTTALIVAGFYTLCIAGLVWVRFFPPLTTMVQLQRRVEAAVGRDDYTHRASWRALDDLPAHSWRAVVAAEDTRFFEHSGFDWEEFRRAGEEAERRGGPRRGASTITQQLVKNLFLTTHRSPIRKVVEYTLTPFAELILPKERILEVYVNVIEWGPGVFGIDAASRHHYGRPASRLTRDQSTRLAAVIPAPRTRRPQNMGAYARTIQGRMRALGW